ncbi:uncharacterized protein DUF4350 [Mucilaginibacter oryzae]|uniref:Uncharacterized protein DUF4350 n=1 Tax=Mucilaginibacter oryzae TaxID=468058 RepID=A0A316H6C4_9SPHI|nr:DUF4350 domain-containing protein [Mucilaginibacter oryzae]PWK76544.1 uncharacterized protein DUF4350 [Mucilaginibacter oryzae]
MKSLRIYLIALGSLMIIYLIAQYNRPKGIDWKESLDINDKIPFGTYILYNRINDLFPGSSVQTYREPLYNVINDHGIKHGAYLIICNSINLNEYDYAKLRKFVNEGNDVFIAASYFGEELGKNFKLQTQSVFINQAAIGIRFSNPKIDTTRLYTSDKGTNTGYFSKIDTGKALVLGKNTEHKANFIEYNIGKGHLYLNANPLMFTNYSLLTSGGMDYAAKALSYVKNGKTLIWDQYYTLGRSEDETTMRVFLRNPALRWAFYLAFFSMAFFVLYEIKRRQRIIPVVEPLKNSTVDFVTVVGQVYYEKRDNTDIAHKKAIYLLSYMRDRYALKTNALDGEFTETLVKKSGISLTLAQNLTTALSFATTHEQITDHELIKLNQLIEQFYIQSR